MTSTTVSRSPQPVYYRTQALASGESIYYRESGERGKHPTLVLLHGFPSSSHMYRDLIPLLSDSFHVIAPDLPGFGHTTTPPSYPHTFDAMATSIDLFLSSLSLTSYSLYIFDYGAPVGLRIALAHPSHIQAIISQNGNAYDEGLGAAWAPLRELWKDNSDEHRRAVHFLATEAAIPYQYAVGFTDISRVSRDGWTLDVHFLSRPGQLEWQTDLFYDYRTNVQLYPAFQQYLRTSQVPLLAVWGSNDPFFVPAGAEAFKRDLPNAEVHLLDDAGHFALESHSAEIAQHIRRFLTLHLTKLATV